VWGTWLDKGLDAGFGGALGVLAAGLKAAYLFIAE